MRAGRVGFHGGVVVLRFGEPMWWTHCKDPGDIIEVFAGFGGWFPGQVIRP